jgi:23S rRNA pseudouridine2604 synthase
VNTTRRTPPAPAPSRVAGTLKVRARAPETEPAEPAADAPDAVTAKQDAAPARKPAASKSGRPSPAAGGERRAKEARARTGAPRDAAERASSRAAPKAAEGRERQPARRTATEAGGKPGRAPAERPARATTDRRNTDRPARAATPRPQPAPRSPAGTAEGAPEGVRLSKVMAERGLCSRREADGLIERGWVFVDGRRITELGTRIDPGANITVAPEARRQQAQRVTILLHKPVGYVSGQPEPGYEPAVVLIKAENQFDVGEAQNFHYSHLKGLAPAGRLDIDSTGLLVLTQDGRIARQLIGDDSKVDKEYLVRVEGELSDEGLALLNHGLELDGRRLRPAQVEWANPDQLRFVLREGRKRQIRRMCELVGLKVVGLKRVRIGKVRLCDLPAGQWRYLREDEHF